MARYKVRKLGGMDIMSVVNNLVRTILALYVGGTLITTFGEVMNNTVSPFYTGLTLIGWTVDSTTNTITNTSGSGVLSVVGLIAIAKVLLQVIRF